MNPKNQQSFSIDAKTCTIKYNSQQNGSTILGNNIKYVIPIYQRPYSWNLEQIKKFISDIFTSFRDNDGNIIEEPMFIGTMQLTEIRIKDNQNIQEVIDGQQRLTTFLTLIKILKLKFPNSKELQDLELDWLYTNVSSGTQQGYLTEFIACNLEQISEVSLNPYIKNAFIITQMIQEESEHIDSYFDFDKFVRYVFTNVYFVVIETKAGLSKTLQIFNAINTTGLDLNGGDIFKIRMYEYLRDRKNEDENKAFENISKLYEKIDKNNADLEQNITGITGILHIYQYVLISTYGLPTTLYGLSVDTFFERLFDTLLNINQWEHFRNNIQHLELSVFEINRIIDARYHWEKLAYPTAEDACMMNLLWWSRYNRYHILVYVLIYRFQEDEALNEKLFLFIKQLSKLFVIFSIRFQKSINQIHSFIHGLTKEISNNSFDEVMNKINTKIGTIDDHKHWYDLENILNGDIVYNSKVKNLICRLSGMLEEDYEKEDKEHKIAGKLFNSPIDIEHIQPFNDKNKEERDMIWSEWGHEINSIGNLVVFNSSQNKSNQNKPYEKKKDSYQNSEYEIVKRISENHIVWNLEKSKKRRESEVEKIIAYLFKKVL